MTELSIVLAQNEAAGFMIGWTAQCTAIMAAALLIAHAWRRNAAARYAVRQWMRPINSREERLHQQGRMVVAGDVRQFVQQNGPQVAVAEAAPITRDELAAELVAQYGDEAVGSLVNRKLLEQKCREQKITITEADIAAEVERTAKEMGIDPEAWYAKLQRERGMTRERYHQDVVWPTLAIGRLSGKTDPEAASDFLFRLKSDSNVAVVSEVKRDDREAEKATQSSRSMPVQMHGGQRALISFSGIRANVMRASLWRMKLIQ